MITMTIELHGAADLPDADLDVLIWDSSDPEAQLGAYVGDGWVNAQGEAVEGVTHWAHMPAMPVRRPQMVALGAGGAVDLNKPWRVPA